MPSNQIRELREQIVRRHMESENEHDFATALATFAHPRYELVATDEVHDGAEAVQEYFKATRTAFPDQRNELISLRHADDAVIVEFWLRGTLAGGGGAGFAIQMTAHFVFDGPTLICERVYFDGLSMIRQLVGRVRWWRPADLLRAARVLRLVRRETGS
jgi:hypothetical protein